MARRTHQWTPSFGMRLRREEKFSANTWKGVNLTPCGECGFQITCKEGISCPADARVRGVFKVRLKALPVSLPPPPPGFASPGKAQTLDGRVSDDGRRGESPLEGTSPT